MIPPKKLTVWKVPGKPTIHADKALPEPVFKELQKRLKTLVSPPKVVFGQEFTESSEAIQDFPKYGFTHSDFQVEEVWECECATKMFHLANVKRCTECGSVYLASPNAQLEDVLSIYRKNVTERPTD